MPKKNPCQIPKRKISNLVSDAEERQYGNQLKRNEELQNFIQDVVRKIVTPLMYPIGHKYLHITFIATFHIGDEDSKQKLSHIYYTSTQKTDEDCSISTVKNVSDFYVTVSEMKYFYDRITSSDPQIWSSFIKKKLCCNEGGMAIEESGSLISYVIDIIYILGAQKDKPIGNYYKRP